MAIRFADIADLPGSNTRAHELAALDGVETQIRDEATPDPLSAQTAETVRTSVVQSFVELNAVQEGIDASPDIQTAMDAAVESFKNLPHTLGEVAGEVAGGAGDAVGNFAGGLLESMFTNHPVVLLLLVGGLYYLVKK